MTEIDVANLALAKLHVKERLTSLTVDGGAPETNYSAIANLDGGLASDISTSEVISENTILTAVSQFLPHARRQILRMAKWTCIQKRIMLATEEREASKEYILDDLVVGLHGVQNSVYKCTTAGTSGSGSITWPISGTVADGTVVWTFQYDVQAAIPENHYTGYLYAAPIPTDYINRVKAIDQYGDDIEADIEAGVLYCDTVSPVLIYIPDENDPEKWDNLLIETVATQLASFLAYPITGSHDNEIALAQAASMIITQAVNQTSKEKRHGQKPGINWYPDLFDRGQR